MKLELTESARKFVDTLDKADLEKVIITEDALESDDPDIYKKFEEHIKARLQAAGDKVRAATAQFKIDYPEYFI